METPHFIKHQSQRIFGMLHRPQGRKAPAVLICHGFTGTHLEPHRIFLKLSRALAKSGIASLRIDFLGSGNSDGDFRSITIGRQIGEARTTLAFLRRQKGIDPGRCGILGMSMGGAVSASVAGLDRRLRALVLWNAVADPLRNFTRIFGGARGIATFKKRGWHDFEGNVLNRSFVDDLPKRKPLELVKKHPGPALILRGSRDRVVLGWQAEAYAKALGARGDLRRLRDADHTFNAAPAEAEAISLSTRFLKKAL